MPILNIAIIGYGTAGQAAAIALSRDGHRIQVFEQVANPGPVGAGFLLQPTGLAALWELGLLEHALKFGAPILRLFGTNASGRAVMDMRYADLNPRLFGLGMQRGALFEIMRDAWPGANLVAGRRIVKVDSAKGEISDQDGNNFGPFDLVVVADGSASQLREAASSVHVNRPYRWGALWSLLPQNQWPWNNELRQRYRAARQMIGMLPVGTRPGDATLRNSFFWSMHAEHFRECRNEPFEKWREDVIELWPEVAPELTCLGNYNDLATANYRDAILGKIWHRDRCVIIGDAAHSMSPQLGQGVNMALLDALALRDALRREQPLPHCLAHYTKQRRDHVAIYHFWSRLLTPLFQSDNDVYANARDLALLPMSKFPIARSMTLRILSGTQSGFFRRYALPSDFEEAFGAVAKRFCKQGIQ